MEYLRADEMGPLASPALLRLRELLLERDGGRLLRVAYSALWDFSTAFNDPQHEGHVASIEDLRPAFDLTAERGWSSGGPNADPNLADFPHADYNRAVNQFMLFLHRDGSCRTPLPASLQELAALQ